MGDLGPPQERDTEKKHEGGAREEAEEGGVLAEAIRLRARRHYQG